MSYNVLLFDDRPQLRWSLTEILQAEGMFVIPCKNVFEADTAWEDHNNEVNAVVLDMMMPSRGLSRNYLNSLDGEQNTGWIWLWHHLNKEHLDPHPATGKCIVIFSAYLEDFTSYSEKLDPEGLEAQFAAGLHLIGKDDEDNIERLISTLSEHRNTIM